MDKTQHCPSQAMKMLRGEKGLPAHYPVPQDENPLFYIQHNNNTDTVVYSLNRDVYGNLSENNPMNVFWKCFSLDGARKGLNTMQKNLAYGYHSNLRRTNCFEFNLVSYKEVVFHLRKLNGEFKVVTKVNNIWTIVENIYVFVENLGLFPKVKYAEIYGLDMRHGIPVYEKIEFNF